MAMLIDGHGYNTRSRGRTTRSHPKNVTRLSMRSIINNNNNTSLNNSNDYIIGGEHWHTIFYRFSNQSGIILLNNCVLI